MNTKGINGASGINALTDLQSDRAKAKKNEADSAAENRSASGVDVSVSAQAREVADARARALDIARNTSDIREDRVAELRARINSGQYKIDPGQIADGMLKEAAKDSLAITMHEEAQKR